MARRRTRLTRLEALDLLVEFKVIDVSQMSMVPGTKTAIDFAFGGIDAHADGFFRRDDVLRLISYAKL